MFDLLKQVIVSLGYTLLNPMQQKVITSIIEGNNVFASSKQRGKYSVIAWGAGREKNFMRV